MKNIYTLLLVILLVGCSDKKDGQLENTTWISESEYGRIEFIIQDHNKVLWIYRHPNFRNDRKKGLYSGEYPSVDIEIYSSSIESYRGIFEGNKLYLYNMDTKKLAHTLEKK